MAYTSPFDIPDDDPEFQAFKTQFLGTGKKQNDPGFVTGIKQGLGGFTSGVGQVAEDLGWKNNPIKSYGDEVQANNPSSAASQSWEGFKESPWQGVKEFAGQGIGSTLPSLAAFLLPGGQGAAATGLARVGQVARGLPMQTALAAAPIYGQVREDQQHQGLDDIPAAAAAAIGGGIVESKLGIQRVLGKATDKPIQSFVGELASSPLKTGLKTWGRTGLEEGAEEIIQQPMQQLGAHRNPLTEESPRDTAWSGFGGLIGGLAMGGVGGAKMGLAHKRVDTFRQADLLNPETPLDMLDKQAQWNQAFIERDQGAEAGQRFYDQRQGEIDQYVESLVDPYRRQAFAEQNHQIDLLADQERIAARAPSYLGQQSDYNPDDERVLNAIDRPNPADYRNWWENVPDPTNPEAYQQFWQHVTDGQESVRDVKRDALGTPLNQELPPGYVPVSFRSNGNAATQVAQESGQGASGVAGGSTGDTQDQPGVGRGGNELAAAPVLGSGTDQSVGDTRVGNGAGVNVTEPAQVVAQAQKANDAKAGTKSGTALATQGVKPGTKARGKAAMDFEVKLNKAIESGEISAEDQLVKDWHAGRKLARDAKEFEQALGDRLAGEALPPVTPEQRLADEAAATGVESEITAPDTDPPAKPSTVAELKGYQSAIQQWLTSMLTPSSPKTPVGELQALVAVMGQKSEDALDQVVDQHRLRAAAAGLGVSHEHVRTQLISALKKIELAAEKAGFSTDTAYELLGLPSTFDIADVENVSAAEAAQAGLTIKGEDYTRSNKAQLSDDEANLGFDGSVTTDDGETVTIDGVSFSEFDEDDAGSAEDSVSNSDKISDIDVTPEEIDEAKAEWEDLDGTELPSKYHKRWAQAYVAREYGVINREEFGSEYADIVLEIESEKAAKVRKLDGQERSGVGEQAQDTARPEQTGSAEGSADGVKQSRGVEGSTQASAIESKLKPLFFSNSRFSSRVVVVQSATALPQNLQSAIDGNTQAFVQGGKVYMIADNIAEGKELAVFLHEVGVHLGMKGLIGQENLNRLAMQIKRWATSNDGSVESELAKKALARVKSAQQGGVNMELGDVIEERVAYFVEEAVNAGINPTALSKSGGPLQQWFRTMWAAVKTALRKFGLDRVHTLTAQNLVDLSYGAARLELEGTWHGTAADFRNFNHEYMGSGEGAQMFGWGTYLAQRPGIAKKYWEDDVRRKAPKALAGGKFINKDSGEVVTLDRAQSWLPDEDFYAIKDAIESGNKRHLEAALQTMLRAIDYNGDWVIEDYPSINKTESPDGSLMRVDTAVHEDEMLDWDKPLSEQNKVRIALMPVRKEIGGNLSELTDIPWNEMDGLNLIGNIYDRGVLVRALEEGYVLPKDSATEEALREGDAYRATSLYLDSIGIKGIKFLDAQSRNQPEVYDASTGYVTDASGSDITTTNGPKGAAHHYLIYAKGDYESALAIVPTWDKHSRKELENMRDSGVAYAVEPRFYVDGVSEPFTTRESAENYIKSLAQNPTRNLVIFNDKNIQRVVTQVGADRERIKFSKSSNIVRTNPQYRKTSTLVRQTLEYLGNKFQSVENNTMFGHQLAQKAEQLMPGTSRYFKSLIQRQTERVKHEQEIARIANRYNELETRDQNALNAFVQKSTMDGKWGFKPTWFGNDVLTTVDQAMKTEFDKLTPAAQQIAKDMFKFGSEQQKRFDTSVNANITDPKKKVPRNQMYGKPYAPLKRFGDHVVVGKSAEFVAEEKAHPGSKRLEEMKADENHYYVEFTDGNWESIKRRDEMAATNPNMTWDSKPLQLENRSLNSVNMTILEKLKNQIEASGNKSTDATKGALKSLANQLYIQQLNQMHANKSQAKRLKVKGAEADMMKAFVSQGRAEAALIANLMTHAESEAGLQQIQTAARTGGNQDAKTRVANAVLRRHLAMLDFQPTPIQNKLMGANSFMMLLTSPAYYLTNATQPFVVSMPYMAGRFGGANSWNTLRDAYKTTLELVKLSTLFKDQNLDAAHLKKFNSVGREAEALQVLLDENLVNVGMEMELGDIASQSKNPAMKNLQKGLQVLKTGVANVEVLNRLSTAVAAYRLAYAEALNKGSSKDAAHEAGTSYARQTIIDTHGDYAGYNAPTVMMQGAFGSMPVKLMTQFKKFQFIQAGLLIGTFRDAYLRGNLNENEKAAAKAMFKWMLGTQAALAGALGGVTGVPMALLGAMMAGVFGDDGEDKEAFLRRILGGGAFAQLILHGAPAAAGVDISKRVGMGAALDPFRMADPQTDWSDYALSLAGPSAGLASRTASGLNYIGKGQYWKGLEMLMPSGILTNASKIARYEAEGLTNSRGDVVMKPEEISLMTDLMQGLGLETTQLSDRRWKAGAIYDRGIHFKEKTSQLQRRYVDAFKDGDREELTAIRQEWMKLQAERVNQGFKRENMAALTQAPMAQKKRERETVNGLQTTQTNKQFVASMDAL